MNALYCKQNNKQKNSSHRKMYKGCPITKCVISSRKALGIGSGIENALITIIMKIRSAIKS